ncbi:hypothetical protein MCAG_02520 [Micromonospora sp. ATCC 39149]|nr:hypothetical protein MCAG_02520 [Micromonospora sp. ATCC 39149]
MPLLRFTSTYQALVSTVAADATGGATTTATPPANAVTIATNATNHLRRRGRGWDATPTGRADASEPIDHLLSVWIC